MEGWYSLRSINSSADDTPQSSGEARYGSDPSSTVIWGSAFPSLPFHLCMHWTLHVGICTALQIAGTPSNFNMAHCPDLGILCLANNDLWFITLLAAVSGSKAISLMIYHQQIAFPLKWFNAKHLPSFRSLICYDHGLLSLLVFSI